MIDILKSILGSPVGSFTFVLGIMLLVGWLIHYVTKVATKVLTEHGSVFKRMDRIETTMDSIKTDISEMKGEIYFLKLSVDTLINTDKSIKKKNPVSLTEEGEILVKENNLDTIIDKNWFKIKTDIKNTKYQNPFDIEQYCLNTAFKDTMPDNTPKFFMEEDVDKIKLLAFKSKFTIIDITKALGILIRDKYFEEIGFKL